jgi:hypothetical protein
MGDRQHVALTKCFYCLEGDRILLAKNYYQTKKGMQPTKDLAPLDGKVIDMEPCQKCADWMKQGIIMIGIDAAKSKPGWEKEKRPNPWRSGGWAVLKEEAFRRLFDDEKIVEFALKHRFMFIEHDVMVMTGMIQSEEKPDEGEMQQGGGVQQEIPEP